MAKKKLQAGPLDRDAFAPLPDDSNAASSAFDDACSDGLENCGSSIGGSELDLTDYLNRWKENLTVCRCAIFAGRDAEKIALRRRAVLAPAHCMHALPSFLIAPPKFSPSHSRLTHQVNVDLDQALVEAAQERLLVAVDAEHAAELCKQAKKLDSTRERLQESGAMLMDLRLEPVFRT